MLSIAILAHTFKSRLVTNLIAKINPSTIKYKHYKTISDNEISPYLKEITQNQGKSI